MSNFHFNFFDDKSFLAWFKYNIFNAKIFTATSLVSVLIGGGSQVYFLVSIDVFYLRFFSISQMLADTVAILFPVFIIGLLLFQLMNIARMVKVYVSEKHMPLSLIVVAIGIGFLGCAYTFYDTLTPKTLFSILLITVSLMSISIIVGLKCVSVRCNKILSKAVLACILVSIPVLFHFAYTRQYLRNLLVSPSGFYNMEEFCTKINSNNCNVKYFNDKYIFTERDDKRIEIYKFGKLFEK